MHELIMPYTTSKIIEILETSEVRILRRNTGKLKLNDWVLYRKREAR